MGYPHNENDRAAEQRRTDNRSNGNQNNSQGQQRGGSQRPEERELMPEGDYPVVATGHRFGYSSNKNPQIGVRLRITEGPQRGKSLLWYGSFTENAQEFTIKALRALGMHGDDVVRDIGQIYEGHGAANAVVKHETFEGETKAKVQWINGADVVMKDEMSPNELSAFSQRMRGAFKRFPGSGAPAAAKTQQQAPQEQRSQQPQGRNDRATSDRGREQQQTFNDRGAPPPGDEDAPWGRG